MKNKSLVKMMFSILLVVALAACKHQKGNDSKKDAEQKSQSFTLTFGVEGIGGGLLQR